MAPENGMFWSWIWVICHSHARTLVPILHASGKCAIITQIYYMIITYKNIHKYIPLKIYHQHFNPSFSIYHPHLYIYHPHTLIIHRLITVIFRINIARFSFLSTLYNTHYMYAMINTPVTHHYACCKASTF